MLRKISKHSRQILVTRLQPQNLKIQVNEIDWSFRVLNLQANEWIDENKTDHFASSTIQRFFSKKKKDEKSSKKGKTQADESGSQMTEIDLNLVEQQYQGIQQEFKETLSKLKFGNLSPEQLEQIEVKAYGEICQMIEVAQVVPKTDKSALLNVYDPGVFDDVKAALDTSDLDLNIQKDPSGFIVTLANANSKESRLAFANGVKQKSQQTIQKLRNIRGDEIKAVKSLADMPGYSEDYLYKAEEEIHQMYLASVKEIESLVTQKLSTVGL